MGITVEQACDSSNWRWRCWDVRADGKVFWQYTTRSKKGECWITWQAALRNKEINPNSKQKYQKTQKYKDYQRLYQKTYNKFKRLYDPIFATKGRVRTRIRTFLKSNGYSKLSKTQEILGCDWNHLKTHLESKFVDGMSWENLRLWHIDHIIPLASAKSVEEVVRLCHYTNLQPLWAEDNMKKSDKILSCA